MCSFSPVKTPKLQLNELQHSSPVEQPSTGECWIPHIKKYTLHSRAKEKTQQDGRRGEIEFRIKPHTCQRLGGLKQNLVHTRTQRPHRHCARPVFESCAEVWVSSGLLQGQGLWVQLPGPHSLWHKPSWRRSSLTHHTAAKQTTHKLQNNHTNENFALLKKF